MSAGKWFPRSLVSLVSLVPLVSLVSRVPRVSLVSLVSPISLVSLVLLLFHITGCSEYLKKKKWEIYFQRRISFFLVLKLLT